jgi:hypothetical protein
MGEELLTGQGNSLPLFETDEAVEKLAHYYLSQIKKKGLRNLEIKAVICLHSFAKLTLHFVLL